MTTATGWKVRSAKQGKDDDQEQQTRYALNLFPLSEGFFFFGKWAMAGHVIRFRVRDSWVAGIFLGLRDLGFDLGSALSRLDFLFYFFSHFSFS